MKKTAVVILAAGKGTRMKSPLPKVLHKLGGIPLIAHVVARAKALNPDKIAVIVGYRSELVREAIAGSDIDFVFQGEQLGTGHAVAQTENILKGKFEQVLILSGDVPNIRVQTLKGLIEQHQKSRSAISFISTDLANPAGYGRVVRDSEGKVLAIVEEKDAPPEIKKIREINSGIYSFQSDILFEALKHIDRKNEQGEYYLTDTVGWAIARKLPVGAVKIVDSSEISGINTKEDLLKLEEALSLTNKNSL